MSKVFKLYKKHWAGFVFGPLLKVLEAFFDLLIPLFMKAVIDLNSYGSVENINNSLSRFLARLIVSFGTWVDNPSLNYALIAGVIIISMGIVGFVVTMISQFLAAITCVKVGSELRNLLFTHILKLSKKDRESVGGGHLVTVVNNDTYQVQQGVLFIVRLLVRCPFIIIGSLIFSFILNVKIGFIFLSIVPIILIFVFLVMRKSSKNYVNLQDQLDDISLKSIDTLEGNKFIHAFSAEQSEAEDFKVKNKNYRKKATSTMKINALVNPLTFAVVSTATVFVIIFAALPMFNNQDGILFASTIIAETSYLGQIMFTLIQLSNVILILTKSSVSRKRIEKVLNIEPSIIDDENPIIKSIDGGEDILTLKDVSMRYNDGDNYVLKNITMNIKKGQSVGIVGGTGSGKSTLISLFNRLNDISSGELLYKGVNIKKYQLESLRNEISVVPQNVTLFKGTIKSNILMAKPEASNEEIELALKSSEAFEFVSKYDDYIDQPVEERGKNFSGGQRQRISLARGLIRNSEILILDDVTSALDLLTEKKVKTNITKNYPGLTKIIVSQRISSIVSCDDIFLINGGEIIAHGNHEELLKTSEIYREIYESQTLNGGN